jgi:hypothetical protein
VVIPLVSVACPLDTIFEECVDQTLRHSRLLFDIVRVLFRCPLWGFFVIKRWLSWTLGTAVAPIAIASPGVCGARALRIGRGLATVRATRAAIASQVLGGELLRKAIGIEALLQVLSLEISLLTLVLSLLVRVLEVTTAAEAIALLLLLLCAPNFLLAGLVRVYGLGKCAWCRGKCSASILELVVPIAAAEIQLQPVGLLVAVHCDWARGEIGCPGSREGLQGGRVGGEVERGPVGSLGCRRNEIPGERTALSQRAQELGDFCNKGYKSDSWQEGKGILSVSK